MLSRKPAIFTVLAIGMAAAAAGAPRDGDGAPMPRVLYGRFSATRPLFVDASEVFDVNGRLRTDGPMSPDDRRALENLLGGSPVKNGCVQIGDVFLDYVNSSPPSSLATAIARSDIVVEARVVNRSYGFRQGIPGQLLRLRPAGMLKGTLPVFAYDYTFIPVGDFLAGSVRFCKTDDRYGAPPSIGDTVFVIANHYEVTNDFVDVIDEAGLVRAGPDGRLSIPRTLAGAGDGVNTVDDLKRFATESSRGRSQRR
jgi:hypothetical protein